MFASDLDKIPEKIAEVKQNLDEYRKKYREVRDGN
jgi:hypothetical protein